eukprot:gnl/MRDRNA2_/MRDRNA2_75206_c0_seq1.p1 gnl/MRDRNA2_/MRDRNA2_75206_c0~~gnl/MRDRNA2_/MRDRNA2_75206_c0_seq1.p1  ORF type:complete len:620 (+),score=147.92 gnl/MRDRNA2_/MRDRNA2_75206_c0_seq1:88-1860(+)
MTPTDEIAAIQEELHAERADIQELQIRVDALCKAEQRSMIHGQKLDADLQCTIEESVAVACQSAGVACAQSLCERVVDMQKRLEDDRTKLRHELEGIRNELDGVQQANKTTSKLDQNASLLSRDPELWSWARNFEALLSNRLAVLENAIAREAVVRDDTHQQLEERIKDLCGRVEWEVAGKTQHRTAFEQEVSVFRDLLKKERQYHEELVANEFVKVKRQVHEDFVAHDERQNAFRALDASSMMQVSQISGLSAISERLHVSFTEEGAKLQGIQAQADACEASCHECEASCQECEASIELLSLVLTKDRNCRAAAQASTTSALALLEQDVQSLKKASDTSGKNVSVEVNDAGRMNSEIHEEMTSLSNKLAAQHQENLSCVEGLEILHKEFVDQRMVTQCVQQGLEGLRVQYCGAEAVHKDAADRFESLHQSMAEDAADRFEALQTILEDINKKNNLEEVIRQSVAADFVAERAAFGNSVKELEQRLHVTMEKSVAKTVDEQVNQRHSVEELEHRMQVIIEKSVAKTVDEHLKQLRVDDRWKQLEQRLAGISRAVAAQAGELDSLHDSVKALEDRQEAMKLLMARSTRRCH